MTSLAPIGRWRFLKPLNLAAYITWLAILIALLSDPGLVGARRDLTLVLMFGFLLAFLARDSLAENARSSLTYVLISLEALIALLLCALWRGETIAAALTIIVIAQCAMNLPMRALIGAAVTVNAGLWYIFAAIMERTSPWVPVLIYGGFQAFAALTAWYARSAQENAAALRQTNAHLLATRSLLEESARDQERLRLARELHDVAGHKLTALKLHLAVLQRDASASVAGSLEIATRLASELLDDLRAVVAQMREHDGIDLRQALTQLVAFLPSPRVHLDLADGVRVETVEQAEALIRAVQEALTNVARHAHADNAWISLRREGGTLRLHVHDDGRGTPPLQEGNGLKGMRERFAALGGTLQFSKAAAGGLALDLILPLRR
jgi:signal transduction histidine kinase